MKSYFLFWKRGFDIKGVSSRRQYWIAILMNLVVISILSIMLSVLETMMYEKHMWDIANSMEDISTALIGIYMLIMMIPSITLTIRRLHDHNNSGWLYLINFIPVIGNFIIFIFMCLGTIKENNNWRMNDIQRGYLEELPDDPTAGWQYEDYVYHMEYNEKNHNEDI